MTQTYEFRALCERLRMQPQARGSALTKTLSADNYFDCITFSAGITFSVALSSKFCKNFFLQKFFWLIADKVELRRVPSVRLCSHLFASIPSAA